MQRTRSASCGARSSSGGWATARAARGVRIAAQMSGAERCKRLESKVLEKVAAEASQARRGLSMKRGAGALTVLVGIVAVAALVLCVAWWFTRAPASVGTATPAPVANAGAQAPLATPSDAPF